MKKAYLWTMDFFKRNIIEKFEVPEDTENKPVFFQLGKFARAHQRILDFKKKRNKLHGN